MLLLVFTDAKLLHNMDFWCGHCGGLKA